MGLLYENATGAVDRGPSNLILDRDRAKHKGL
jgi:hypothetical protein